MFRFLKNRPVSRLLALIMVDALFFGLSDPDKTPSFLLIVGFILFVATFYYLASCLASLAGLYGLKLKHKKPLTIYLTVIVGILVALQSVGELGARDIWVLLPLAILGYFYSSYAKAIKL